MYFKIRSQELNWENREKDFAKKTDLLHSINQSIKWPNNGSIDRTRLLPKNVEKNFSRNQSSPCFLLCTSGYPSTTRSSSPIKYLRMAAWNSWSDQSLGSEPVYDRCDERAGGAEKLRLSALNGPVVAAEAPLAWVFSPLEPDAALLLTGAALVPLTFVATSCFRRAISCTDLFLMGRIEKHLWIKVLISS